MILLTAVVLAGCSQAPGTRGDSQAMRPTGAPAAEPPQASVDSAVQFLLAAAVTDFHTHRPPDPARFRDVRVGRLTTPGGEEHYLLCGQFLPAQGGSQARWTPFVTIKTSGYEQWLGPQATGFCQGSSVVWVGAGDLSSSLQSRLASLR